MEVKMRNLRQEVCDKMYAVSAIKNSQEAERKKKTMEEESE
jgi:hypothetical protein